MRARSPTPRDVSGGQQPVYLDRAVIRGGLDLVVQGHPAGIRRRHDHFFSLVELNGAIRALLTGLNGRPTPSRGQPTAIVRAGRAASAGGRRRPATVAPPPRAPATSRSIAGTISSATGDHSRGRLLDEIAGHLDPANDGTRSSTWADGCCRRPWRGAEPAKSSCTPVGRATSAVRPRCGFCRGALAAAADAEQIGNHRV